MTNTRILLASSSPRRLELLKALDLPVRLVNVSFQESINPVWALEDVPLHLAIQKNEQAESLRKSGEILITADTIVLHKDQILHKPGNREEALLYLDRLSNDSHKVITSVCLSKHRQITFSVSTEVCLDMIPVEDIEYYVDTYKPYDKAGGYGIQEWIGWSYISTIKGSYSSVMGLPTSEVYKAVRQLGC